MARQINTRSDQPVQGANISASQVAVVSRDFKGEKVEAAPRIFFGSFCGARSLPLRPVRRFMVLRLTRPPYPYLNEACCSLIVAPCY